MRKTTITQQDYDTTQTQAAVARQILESKKFQFIRDYLQNSLTYIEESILNNTIKDVDESVTITENIIKTFKTPKKVQIDEMVGQYKLIKKFLADMQAYATLLEDLDEEIAQERVIIRE